MSDGITLSPKYGANPSLDICLWCGKPRGVVLFGRIHEKKGDRTDVEAPKEMVTSPEPCDDCKAQFAKGVRVVEVDLDGSRFHDDKQFAFLGDDGQSYWPTGRWAVVKPEAVKGGGVGSTVLCDADTMSRLLQMTGNNERGAQCPTR